MAPRTPVFVNGLAALVAPQCEVCSIAAGVETLPATIEFQDGVPRAASDGRPEYAAETYEVVRRSSGVRNSRSAPRSTVFAAAVARALQGPSPIGETGIAIASTSATAGIAYAFERRGLTEGWNLVDPFGLPNTIPSAASTQTALALQSHAFAVTFLDGLLGFAHALEFAAVMIEDGRADDALVIGTDEVGAVQQQALAGLGLPIRLMEGAAGLRITSTPPRSPCWRLGAVAAGCGEPPTNVDASAVQRIVAEQGIPTLYSYVPVFALSRLFSSGHSSVMLELVVSGRGWNTVSFERD